MNEESIPTQQNSLFLMSNFLLEVFTSNYFMQTTLEIPRKYISFHDLLEFNHIYFEFQFHCAHRY